MKIPKTALVSAISLGIAMSAAALSAGPSLAQQRPHLPVLGKQACVATALVLTPAATPVDTGLGITFTLGAAKQVQLLFSTELNVTGAQVVTLAYSIDNGAKSPIGPATLLSGNAALPNETRTAYAVTASLPKGIHTIVPFLTGSILGATANARCFAVMNTGL